MEHLGFEHKLEKLNAGDKGEEKPLLLRPDFAKRRK